MRVLGAAFRVNDTYKNTLFPFEAFEGVLGKVGIFVKVHHAPETQKSSNTLTHTEKKQPSNKNSCRNRAVQPHASSPAMRVQVLLSHARGRC